MKKVITILTNVQILSALIWAVVILGCSYYTKESAISNILITAAGMHVILLTTMLNKEKVSCEDGVLLNEVY